MHIGILIERFEAAGGGLEHAAWQTAKALVEAGDEVSVGCRRSAPEASAAAGITTVHLAAPSFWQPLRIRRYAARASAWLTEAKRAGTPHRIDLSHAWSRVPGADVFHTGEGSHADYMRRTYGERGAALRRVSPRHIAQLGLEREVYTRAGVVAQCVSERVARELRARFDLARERTPVVGYGVDTERFSPVGRAERETARRNLIGASVDSQATLFAFVGSGWRRKGLDTAIAALGQASDRAAQLCVAGRDDPRPWRQLAQQAGVAERVHFVGEQRDIASVYAACDAWLLPTRYDAFGLVGLEAAACGLPGIVSRNAGVSEVVGDAARVVDVAEDIRAFAAEIDLLCDATERAPLSERGVAIAAANTWREKTRELRALYTQVGAR